MKFTCKLPVVGRKNFCILHTEWSKHEINFLLLHNNTAWNGKFQLSGNEMTDLLEQLWVTEEEYLKEAKTALTTHGGAENFIYSIENDKFTWKKYVRKDMAVKFGFIRLSLLPVFDTFEKVIDNILESHIEMSDKLASITKEKQVLEKDVTVLKGKLDSLVDEKGEMEATLYCQFLGVLNEKKKMIKGLKKKTEPVQHYLNDSDSQHSNSNHFESETEIDSEEETHSPIKVEDVESKSRKERTTSVLPKRSRQPVKQEVAAGPSGMNKLSSKALVDDPNKSLCLGTRKSKRNNCSLKTISETNKNNNSEEDAFTFPKRSKRIKNPAKICYDSDDDIHLERVIKIEPETDSFPNKIKIPEEKNFPIKPISETNKNNNSEEDAFMLPKRSKIIKNPSKISSDSDDDTNSDRVIKIEPKSDIVTNKIKISDENNFPKTNENSENAEMKSNLKNENPSKKPELEENTKSFNRFSSSTLNMLNNLV